MKTQVSVTFDLESFETLNEEEVESKVNDLLTENLETDDWLGHGGKAVRLNPESLTVSLQSGNGN
jgi:hypothetical protein